MLSLAGLPLFFLEMSFGQFASEGVISIWKVCPLFQGIGWGMFLVSLFISVYYNMVIAWTLFYLFASFRSDVPWRECKNTLTCGIEKHFEVLNCTEIKGGLWYNHSCLLPSNDSFHNTTLMKEWDNVTNDIVDSKITYASDDYFHHHVLQISKGFHEFGSPQWHLALTLLLSWILVFICLSRGIKSAGKAVYFTAIFPYVVLIILLIRGLTLPGAMKGVLFYLTPEWKRLLNAKVWGDAAVQIFFSLSPCWGGLIVLSSYNKFNNNCLRDAMVVSIGNCLTSFFAGFVIFSIVGFMAERLQMPVGQVAKPGAGLAFIVYPEVVANLPISPLWAILFFMMLITLGLGTQFAVVTTVHTTLLDIFPNVLRVGKRPIFVLVFVCLFGYCAGLACTSNGGMYLLQLIDNFAATYSVLIIGLCECIAISWIYGIDRFSKDIEQMLGHQPAFFFKFMWKFGTPILLIAIILFTWFDYSRSSYGDYVFPVWADVGGWFLSFTSVMAIPFVMIYKLVTTSRLQRESFFEKVKRLCRPTDDWGTQLNKDDELYGCQKRFVLYADSATASEMNLKELGERDQKLNDAKHLLQKEMAPLAVQDIVDSPYYAKSQGDMKI